MNVYLISVEEIKDLDASFFCSRFPERMEKARNYKKARDYLLSLGASALIWYALGLDEKDISVDKNGKPYALDGRCFSISHSGDYVALACDDSPVGVDIEVINEGHLGVAKRTMTEEEIGFINGDAGRFFTLWTLKECVMKASGQGLSAGANNICVLPLVDGKGISFDDRKWYADTVIIDDYLLSVCSLNPVKIECVNVKKEDI